MNTKYKIAMGMLAGRGLEAHLEGRDGIGPDAAHGAFHGGVAAGVAPITQLAPQPHSSEPGEGCEPLAQIRQERISAYRPKTKGKVERPFRYIREDFFLGGTFRNLDDLNIQLRNWLDTVANPRVHATTQRVVNEAFAQEKPNLKTLPLAPYRAVLKLERRVSHEGMVSVGGNLYSVPDTTRRRILDVHVFANEIRIFENGAVVASHLALEGRDQTRLDPAHRKASAPSRRRPSDGEPVVIRRRLAGQGGAR